MKFDSTLVHGSHQDSIKGAVIAPIFNSTTYLSDGTREYASIRYGRLQNTPTALALGEKLAAIEGTEAATSFSSGMAAISSTLLALVPEGGHLVAQDELYGASQHFLQHQFKSFGRKVSFFSAGDTHAALSALKPGVSAVYVEGLSNPCLRIPDFKLILEKAQEAGALSIIDNTFASPVNFRPATLGFDVVLHSATKYLNGHSDIIAGVSAGRADCIAKVRAMANYMGGCLDSQACYLLDRGLKTLGVRVRAQNQSALRLAQALEAMPQVSKVHYPFLESHKDYARARQYLTGGGGMLAFELAASGSEVDDKLSKLKLASVAVSLGGVETLVTRPAITSHLSLTQAERDRQGVSDGLVRVSVGLEDTEDLIEDFRLALN